MGKFSVKTQKGNVLILLSLTLAIFTTLGLMYVASRNKKTNISSVTTPNTVLSANANTDIYGVVDPSILGNCPPNVHDRYVLKGPDGKTYRTWHPQTVPLDDTKPNGEKCIFAHEHGDNPDSVINKEIKSYPILFGYIGKRMSTVEEPKGHDEAHEGFKVFVSNRGQINDEGRINVNDSRLVFHMGTGGPKRFDTQFHSMDYKVVTPDGKKMFVQAMADTGGVGSICDTPRSGKTVVTLGSKCKLDSLYEIWEAKLNITNMNKKVVGQAVASVAVFDPITVMDPKNHTRLVNTWSPELNSSLKFPNNDRSGSRDCNRESYMGPTFWSNKDSNDVYYTDAMGMETPYGDLKQILTKSDSGGSFKATRDGSSQFKYKSNHCSPDLGIKN